MSNPSVTATILVDDKASPALKELHDLAKRIGAETAKAMKSPNGDAYAGQFRAATAAANEHLSVLGKIQSKLKEFSKGAGVGMGLGLGNFVAKNWGTEKSAQDILSRLENYTGIDKSTVDKLRETARRRGVNFHSGVLGYMEEARSAANANIPATALPRVAEIGQQFADYLGEGPGEGFEKAQNVAEYLGYFKTKAGKKTNMAGLIDDLRQQGMSDADATAAATEQMKKAAGEYSRWAKVLPGKERELFDFMKYAMPSAEAAGASHADVLSTYLMMSAAGIKGEHAGTYLRGMFTRGQAPSNVAIQAATAAGVDLNKYREFDPSIFTGNSFSTGIAQTFSMNAAAKAAIAKTVDGLKQSGVTDPNVWQSRISEAIMQNAEGKKSLMDADLVNKRVAKQLGVGMKGFHLLDMLEDMTKQGKDTTGLIRGVFGLEANTPVKQITLQDIDRARKQGAGALFAEGGSGAYAGEWDKMIEGRINSFANTIEGVTQRQAASLDLAVQEIEGPMKRLAGIFNSVVDSYGAAGAAISALGNAASGAAGTLGALFGYKMLFGGGGAAVAEGVGAGGAAAAAGGAAAGLPWWIPGSIAAGGLGASWLATNAVKNLTDEQKDALIDNPFGGDYSLAAAIMKGGKPATSDPLYDNVYKPIGDQFGYLFGGIGKDLYRIVHGDYGELAAKYGGDKKPILYDYPDYDLKTGARPSTTYEVPQIDRRGGEVQVQGEVTGSAEIKNKIVVEPSQWFITKIQSIEQAIVSLKGQLGGDKMGTNHAGSNGAQPSFGGTGAQPY